MNPVNRLFKSHWGSEAEIVLGLWAPIAEYLFLGQTLWEAFKYPYLTETSQRLYVVQLRSWSLYSDIIMIGILLKRKLRLRGLNALLKRTELTKEKVGVEIQVQ